MVRAKFDGPLELLFSFVKLVLVDHSDIADDGMSFTECWVEMQRLFCCRLRFMSKLPHPWPHAAGRISPDLHQGKLGVMRRRNVAGGLRPSGLTRPTQRRLRGLYSLDNRAALTGAAQQHHLHDLGPPPRRDVGSLR